MRLCVAFCTLWLIGLASSHSDELKLVCYFANWAYTRTGVGGFGVGDIDPTLCTHLVYAFIGITEDGNVDVLDKWNDLPDGGGNAGFEKFVALRKLSPKTKFMVSMGGWNQGTLTYSNVAANSTLRTNFVRNVVKFTRRHKFDGFDMDWEYPGQRDGKEEDVENFVLLLKQLRCAFRKHDLILSTAVGAPEFIANLSYNVSGISKYVDFINLMTFEYHHSWDPITGHNTPLYPAERETTELELSLNINSTVNYWLAQGAPPEKLIIGTAFYGKTFTLKDSAAFEPGSAVIRAGDAGEYTKEAGMMGYYEICDNVVHKSWTSIWDEEQRVPYAHLGDQWVTYDNVKSIAEKANYIKERGLGGAMVWSIDTDDFRGTCGEPSPLLKALHMTLYGNGAGCLTSHFAVPLACLLAVFFWFSEC